MVTSDVWQLAQSTKGETVNYHIEKAVRFVWRVMRNLLCITTWGRKILFPSQSLAERFGRDDADYAVKVFLHHYRQLSVAGFHSAEKILEIGPGRNLGTSLLMWALNHSRETKTVTMILWDVFPNMVLDMNTLASAARSLLDSPDFQKVREVSDDPMVHSLSAVASKDILPDIRYHIKPLSDLVSSGESKDIALVYSQAAIEHIWNIADFWQTIISLTKPGGWHSHRIDLADHGSRETNYIEMLEWSPLGYWMAMRFIPGAINRWRASMHLDFLARNGLNIVCVSRETKKILPIKHSRINRSFSHLEDVDIRTTAIDLVAVKADCRKIKKS